MYRGARGSPSHQTFKACTEQKYSWTTQTCTADVGLYLLSSFWSNLSSITVPKRCFPRTQNAAKISTTADLFRWSKVLCLLQLRPLCFVGVTPSPFAVARSRFLSANADCKTLRHLRKLLKWMPLGICQKLAGRDGGGNFKFGFGNEMTHPCNGSEIC